MDTSFRMLQRYDCTSEKVGPLVSALIYIHNHHHQSGRAEERVAKLVDSPDKPESEASYKLDEGGWADV